MLLVGVLAINVIRYSTVKLDLWPFKIITRKLSYLDRDPKKLKEDELSDDQKKIMRARNKNYDSNSKLNHQLVSFAYSTHSRIKKARVRAFFDKC